MRRHTEKKPCEEAETGVICPQAKERLQPPEAGKGRKDPRLEPMEGARPCVTLILTFGFQTVGRRIFVGVSHQVCDHLFWWPQDTSIGSILTGTLPSSLPVLPSRAPHPGLIPRAFPEFWSPLKDLVVARCPDGLAGVFCSPRSLGGRKGCILRGRERPTCTSSPPLLFPKHKSIIATFEFHLSTFSAF